MAANIPKHVLVAQRQRQNRRRGVIEDLEAIFGAPPVLGGEDELAYHDLAARVRAAMQPRDVIEEIYARDVADLQWEAMRHRRAVANIQNAATRRAALRMIRSASPDLARALDQSGEPSDEKIFSALARLGLSFDKAQAEGLTECLEQVERINALAIKAKLRRDAIIREYDRRRELASRMNALARVEPADPVEPLKALPKAASGA